MTPQLKLTYFNLAGRAELTRLALASGQVPFEDERLQQPDFLAIKSTLPLGQLPCLTVDGAVYSQSLAIARYAAKLAGSYPQDPLQALRVDMVVDTIMEAGMLWVDFYVYEKDQAKKQEKALKFLDVTIPQTFGALETMIMGDFFLGTMSLADLALFSHIENGIKVAFPEFKLDAFPKVNRVYTSVKTHPNIADYLAKQQVTK